MRQCPVCKEYFYSLRSTYCTRKCRQKQYKLKEKQRDETKALNQGTALVDKLIYLHEPNLEQLQLAEKNILAGVFKQVILIGTWPAWTPTEQAICVQLFDDDGTGIPKAMFWQNYEEADRQLIEIENAEKQPQPPNDTIN